MGIPKSICITDISLNSEKDPSVYVSQIHVYVPNLWAVGWTKVPIRLLTNKALCLGLLLLDLLGDRLQFLRVQLGIQGTHLTNRAGEKTVGC